MKQELQKAMLIGMYLSKYDKHALTVLGFETFTEACNIIGLAINAKPLSIRNYRDEFDPFFPNQRKGWHKRPMFRTRKEMLSKYDNLGFNEFTEIIKSLIYKNPDIDLIEDKIEEHQKQNTFAKRLLTGQAAEQYFKNNYRLIDIFNDYTLEDTTKQGCGFDFRLSFGEAFFVVEVKGLAKEHGGISLTHKEYQTATYLRENYFIFLVKNFVGIPNHSIFRNPIFTEELMFTKQEKMIKQTSWNANIS